MPTALHVAASPPATNFRVMEQFFTDAANGTLPDYAFIEPRMVFNHNDMHPPWGATRDGELELPDGSRLRIANSADSDVRAGDKLAQDVYDAIRTSTATSGSNAMNTALVITFDEHGGTFDHVAPPAAVPPDASGPGEMGFTFDRLGLRVPAIVVSAYTAAATVIHDEMHHQRPLTPPARGLLGLLAARFDPGSTLPATYGEAYDALVEHGTGLFGAYDTRPPN